MKNIKITSVKYIELDNKMISIFCFFDGLPMSVPLDPKNRHYKIIMRKVETGELVIEESNPSNDE